MTGNETRQTTISHVNNAFYSSGTCYGFDEKNQPGIVSMFHMQPVTCKSLTVTNSDK